eukprot:SAG11_NODE_1004_length_6210_cov_14.226150_4_plen_179_part_00
MDLDGRGAVRWRTLDRGNYQSHPPVLVDLHRSFCRTPARPCSTLPSQLQICAQSARLLSSGLHPTPSPACIAPRSSRAERSSAWFLALASSLAWRESRSAVTTCARVVQVECTVRTSKFGVHNRTPRLSPVSDAGHSLVIQSAESVNVRNKLLCPSTCFREAASRSLSLSRRSEPYSS